VVSQPTWGVDVGAAAQIRAALLALRDEGCALLVVSEELEELFEISDTLVVMSRGRVSPSLDPGALTPGQVGEWMGGAWPESVEAGAHAAAV
jgi:general nucleoside transport system ATP-binding protein